MIEFLEFALALVTCHVMNSCRGEPDNHRCDSVQPSFTSQTHHLLPSRIIEPLHIILFAGPVAEELAVPFHAPDLVSYRGLATVSSPKPWFCLPSQYLHDLRPATLHAGA